MLDTSFLLSVIRKNAKKIILFVVLTTIAGGIVCLLLPKYYSSSAIVMPSNPKLTDKNYIYGQGTIELNGAYGMEEDADRLLTQLRLSSNFSTLVDSFKLIKHYKIKNNSKAKANAQENLVSNSNISKTETGAIKITVWDKDKELAASMANALVHITELKAIHLSKQAQLKYIESLEASINAEKQILGALELEKKMVALTQLKTVVNANLPTINILEPAYPSQKADKPKLKYWLIASFMASVALAVFGAVVLETYKKA